MKTKRKVLTIFFVILTLTIGITTITPLASSNNKAEAVESKVNELLKKICPSYEKSNGIKDKFSNIVKSCILQTIPTQSPPSTGQTATLKITTILRANCGPTDGGRCPNPDGFVSLYIDRSS